MIEPRQQEFLIGVPNEMVFETDPTWFEGFKATVAYNNKPMVESVLEEYKFGQLEIDPNFDIKENISEDLLPYYRDLARAKNLEHLKFLEQRVRDKLDRRNVMNNSGITSQIAGSIVDPLFLTSFVPMLNAATLGKTVVGAAMKMGAIGGAYSVASEARRAPFDVADEEYEAAYNIAAGTLLTGLTGGALKGASFATPFVKSSAAKAYNAISGKPVKHFIDEKGNMEVGKTDTPFNLKFYNPFGSPVQKFLFDKSVPQDIKEILYKLSSNSSVASEGAANGVVMPQSVNQMSAVYNGVVREFDELMRGLYEEHSTSGVVKEASTFFGAFTKDFNPFNKEYDSFVEDLFRRYINSNSPDPKVARAANEGLSEPQKRAFTEIKKFFHTFDEDARYVGLLKDDASIVKELTGIGERLAAKRQTLADIDENVRARQGTTKAQSQKIDDINAEIAKMQTRADMLEEALNSPTRKNFLFPIFYNKELLQNEGARQRLTKTFEDHYAAEGLPNPKESAEKTLSRIMEEDAEDLEDLLPTGAAGNAKHLMHRKTNINEWQIADYMVLNMDAIYTYATRMGKKIEFARAYGGKNVDELLSEIETSARKSKFSEKKIADLKTAFYGEYQRTMGALVRNPSRLNNQLAQFAKSYAGWTYLGGAGISAISDVGTVVLAHGMKDVVRAGFAGVTDSGLRGAVIKDAAHSGIGIEMARAMTQQRLLGDSIKSIQPTKLEKIQQFGDRYYYAANLLGPITFSTKTLDQILVNDRFIKHSKKLLDNELDAWDTEYLARYGIDVELAKYIQDMPTQTSGKSTFQFANIDEWPINTPSQRMMKRRYQAAVNAHADNAVIMGQAFDRPLIVDGVTYIRDNAFTRAMRSKFPNMFEIDKRASTASVKMVRLENGAMTVPFTFMNFVFGANNKILGAVMDPNRKYRLQGAVALIGLSYVSFQIKDRYWWNKMKKDVGEDWTNSPDVIARLIDHSGLVGIYGDLGYMGLSMAAHLSGSDGKNWPISPKYVSPDTNKLGVSDRFLDGITEPFGAPVGLGIDTARAVSDFLNGNYEDGRKELAGAFPFLGLPLIGQDMKEIMVGSGRYY